MVGLDRFEFDMICAENVKGFRVENRFACTVGVSQRIQLGRQIGLAAVVMMVIVIMMMGWVGLDVTMAMIMHVAEEILG